MSRKESGTRSAGSLRMLLTNLALLVLLPACGGSGGAAGKATPTESVPATVQPLPTAPPGPLAVGESIPLFSAYLSERGLAPDTIAAVLVDRADRVWAGTKHGVFVYGSRQSTATDRFFPAPNAPQVAVRAFVLDSTDTLWVGTQGGGLLRWDGKTWTTVTTANGLPDNTITALAVDKDNQLWVGTPKGLAHGRDVQWRTETMKSTKKGLPSDRITALLVDTDGHIWAATPAGIGLFDGRQWQTITVDVGLPGNQITTLAQDRQKRIWAGTNDSGLGVYDVGQWQIFTTGQGLPTYSISALCLDLQGWVWVGTAEGIAVYTGLPTLREDPGATRSNATSSAVTLRQFPFQRWHYFTSEQGLPARLITALAVDAQGQVWIGTDTGLVRYNGA